MRLIRLLLELIFPSKCVLCRNLLEKQELDLCGKCRADAPCYHKSTQKLRLIRDYTALWYYEEYPRQSLLRYKFANARSYSAAYGRLLAMRIVRDFPEQPDVITWVPIGPKRKLKRGYDQVELLACAVGSELGIPVRRLLTKPKDNPPQSGIDNAPGRRANVLGVYRLTNRKHIENQTVLLLDDIITTGATVSECARMLLEGKAKNVYCAAVAAGRNHKQ